MHHLEPLTMLAMSLVLLELGSCFPLAHLRPVLRHAIWLSLGELVLTFSLVACAVFLQSYHLPMALILGALALATAPATTVLVLKESNSEGPVTEFASVLVALNNIAAIIVFELIFLLAQVLSSSADVTALQSVMRLAADLGGALTLGSFSGLLISYGCGLLSQRWLVMVLAVATLQLGLCESLHLPYMLSFLMAGVVVVNTSDQSSDLFREMEKLSGLLVVVFFAVHGAELDLQAFLQAGVIGLVYIVARAAGKIIGIRWAARLRGEAATVRRYLGSSLLAQAGAAIALANLAAQRWPEVGQQVESIILGTVVVFEIVGPILTRWSVLNAGEVPLAQAISHRSESVFGQFGKMWARGREALGILPQVHVDLENLKVEHLLRRSVQGLPQTTEFDDVIAYIRRSHDNTYFVVNDEYRMVGVIRYAWLSDIFFDATIDTLVRAEDLAGPVKDSLSVDEPLSRAVELFRSSTDDAIPVVKDLESEKFLGVVRRDDLTDLIMRQHK